MTFSKIYKKLHRAFDVYLKCRDDLFKVHFSAQISKLSVACCSMLEKQSNIFLKPAYLEALEKSGPSGMRFAYACVEKDSKPVAFMYFQLLEVRLDKAESFLNPRYFSGELSDLMRGSKNIFLKKYFSSPIHIMFCGNVFLTGEHGIYIDPAASHPELIDSLPLLMEEVIERAGKTCRIAGVVVKDFYEDKMNALPALEKAGYRKFYFEPNMVMDIRVGWHDFEDYISDLSSKYRVRTRNVLKKASEVETMEFTEKDIRSNGNEIEKLYREVHRKAAVHFSEINASYFTGLKNRLKNNFIFKAFYLDGRMVAFSTAVISKDSLEAHLVGIDYEFNKSYSLYPFMLYEFIRDAISRKSKVIHFGRTALEIKSTVGAKARAMYCYLGLQKPLSIRMISPFIDTSVEKELIERDPFKESNGMEAGQKQVKMAGSN